MINKIIFCGTPEFSVPVLKILNEKYSIELIITQPDKKKGRKQKISFPEVKKTGIELGLEIIQPSNINSDEVLEKISDIGPDVIITAAYGGYLKKNVLDLPKYGCWNLHPSLLPYFRGASPIRSAIINGDKFTGNTIYRMTRKMDAGPIIYQWKTEIGVNEDYGMLHDRLSNHGAEDMISALEILKRDGFDYLKKQNHSEASYCEKIFNNAQIDWSKSADEIMNTIRAYAPKPGAFTLLRGKRVKLIKVRPSDIESDVEPGTILRVTRDEGILVKCQDKVVSVTEVQREGKKIMKSFEFNLGARISENEKFIQE